MGRVSIVVLSLLTLFAGENKGALDDTWVLETAKGGVSERIIMKVVQDRDCLTVIEISKSEHGKTISKYKYPLNGREVSAGKALLFEVSGRREQWTLSKNGRELLIDFIDGNHLVFKRSRRDLQSE